MTSHAKRLQFVKKIHETDYDYTPSIISGASSVSSNNSRGTKLKKSEYQPQTIPENYELDTFNEQQTILPPKSAIKYSSGPCSSIISGKSGQSSYKTGSHLSITSGNRPISASKSLGGSKASLTSAKSYKSSIQQEFHDIKINPDANSNVSSEATLPSKQINSRSKISSVDKRRIIDAYQGGENMKTVGRLLNIKEGTLKNILYRFNKSGSISSGKIGGYRKKMITEEVGDALLAKIDSHPELTLAEMKIFLAEKQCFVSPVTISSFLKNKFYTFKKLRFSAVEKNSDRVKELRKEYVKNILSNSVRSKQCIYIDETYCNIWTQRLRGRSARGQPAYLQVPTKKGPNVAILMAIGKGGPIYFEIHQGTITQPIYQQFLIQVSLRLESRLFYFIHDNASIHNDVLTTTENHKILKLPPYSPFLNPIENYFSKIKSKLRRKLTDFDLSQNISNFEVVKKSIEEIMETEKDINLSDYYHHIKTYYPKSLLMENIY